MRRFILAFGTLFLTFGCSTVATPGALKAQRAPRRPIVPIQRITLDGLSVYTHVPSPEWRDQIIYFVVTDRFDDGDPTNSNQGAGEYNPASNAQYSGGDLRGIIDNLDYIKGMGMTSVWITPPNANQWWDPLNKYGGYHGYWAEHFREVDAHMGTLEMYKLLSANLHANGMYLIQDIVPNHTGNFFTFKGNARPGTPRENLTLNLGSKPNPRPTQYPFDMNDFGNEEHRNFRAYHWTPAISNYNNEALLKNYQLSELDDINTENPVVRKVLKESFGYWIREVGVDAFRVDTVKYVPLEFWQDFFHSASAEEPGILAQAESVGKNGFTAFGEAWYNTLPYDEEGDIKMAAYLGTRQEPGVPSLLNFSLNTDIRDVFGSGKPTDRLRYRWESLYRNYPDPTQLYTFIDNHDMTRFRAGAGEKETDLALFYLFTNPGIPIVYYGTEQGFVETRASMFADGFGSGGVDHFEPQADGYQWIKSLAELRLAHRAFRYGRVNVLNTNAAGAGALIYTLQEQTEKALVMMNTAPGEILADNIATGFAPGTVLKSALQRGSSLPDTLTVGAGGIINVKVPGLSAAVYFAHATAAVPRGETAVPAFDRGLPAKLAANGTLTGRTNGASSLQVIVNGQLASPLTPTVNGPAFSVVFPAESLGNGRHHVVITGTAPGGTEVVSAGLNVEVELAYVSRLVYSDPLGDDSGPAGKYKYPTDPTFTRNNDIAKVELLTAGTGLKVSITMNSEISTTWNPLNGFDHVYFSIFMDVPGAGEGATVLPFHNASTPAGMSWNRFAFIGGWTNFLHAAPGAGPSAYGTPIASSPSIQVDKDAKRIDFTFSGGALGNPSTLSGTKVYILTWDYDGLESALRHMTPEGGPYIYAGGDETKDPMIMDDTGIITIP